ncbi:MarR family winged helix-turn-helix transcriptional regulator [Streptomyces coeruleorubidus]|uniref:MarR family winged helix-turn-helix transcriptional regulator n=1 Tax=Streptomyces coeruleorubidus TaxID=116188 RepID=UPI0036A70B18
MNKQPTRWLTPVEQDCWRSVMRMYEKLGGRLNRHLQAESDLSGADYAILVSLTDVPDGRMRHVDLAKCLEWEKSRMSHQITRMVKRGLVERQECAEDGRGAFVAITPKGREVIEEAAPRHVEAVRRLFVEPLTPEELRTFACVADRVVEHVEKQSL